ncbi:hypothetical protein Trydic_g15762, partial [Trypoxylus dichotomus]
EVDNASRKTDVEFEAVYSKGKGDEAETFRSRWRRIIVGLLGAISP